MRTNTAFPGSKSLRTLFFMCFSLLSYSAAAATGPVPVGSLPGGGSLTDSDAGTGEQWGRAGGRDLSYTGLNPSLFSLLQWGPTGSGSVGIAFDGVISAGTAEQLSYSASDSNLSGGMAVWLGSTSVNLSTGPQSIDTRFVLTLSQGGAPLTLITNPLTGLPGVDVLASGSAFTANLRMEAKLNGSPVYVPALDLYDNLSTDPNLTEQAQTSFSRGFYFEALSAGLSLEEHDANMQSASDTILGDLAFHNTETVNRLSSLDGDHIDIKTSLNTLLQDMQTLLDEGNEGDFDQILDALQEFQTNLMQVLWGVEFDSDGNPDYDTVTPISSLARSSLDLQVVHPAQASNSSRRMLVLATEGGEMVGGVDINVVAAISDNDFTPVVINEFYVTEIAPGLLSLEIPLRGKQNSIKTFLILAERSVDGYGTTNRGSILTSDSQ